MHHHDYHRVSILDQLGGLGGAKVLTSRTNIARSGAMRTVGSTVPWVLEIQRCESPSALA